METFLQPERFDADLNSATVAKEWSHWLKTFKNFIQTVQLSQSTDKEDTVDSLVFLTSYKATRVYDYIVDCTSYKKAEEVLTGLYVKPKNEIFARHVLATRHQQPGESLNQFLQALKVLVKHCQCKAVTAVEACDGYVRGLSSHTIRQLLLESITLNLQTTCERVQTLEMAQHSVSYSHSESINAAMCQCKLKPSEEQEI